MKNKKLFAILTLVCFMFTLMPVAAFAEVNEQKSYIYVEEAEVDVDEKATLAFGLDVDATTNVYVWFEEVGYEDVAVKGVTVTGTGASVDGNGIITVVNPTKNAEIEVAFNRDGEFEVHAAVGTVDAAKLDEIKTELRTQRGYDVITVSADADETSDYVLTIVGDCVTADADADVAGKISDGETATLSVLADNANGIDVTPLSFILENG